MAALRRCRSRPVAPDLTSRRRRPRSPRSPRTRATRPMSRGRRMKCAIAASEAVPLSADHFPRNSRPVERDGRAAGQRAAGHARGGGTDAGDHPRRSGGDPGPCPAARLHDRGEARAWLRDAVRRPVLSRLARTWPTWWRARSARTSFRRPRCRSIWARHIVDCAQLIRFRHVAPGWLDLGTGAGFPGLVVARLTRLPTSWSNRAGVRIPRLAAAALGVCPSGHRLWRARSRQCQRKAPSFQRARLRSA